MVDPERQSQSSPDRDDDELQKLAKERLREETISHMAYVIGQRDPVFLSALEQRKAVESAMDARGRARAAQIEQEREKAERERRLKEYPWGIDYLKLEHSMAAIRQRIEHDAQKASEIEAFSRKQEEQINEDISKARGLTLKFSQIAAEQLSAHNIVPDTEARVQHTTSRKQFSWEAVRLNGKLRREIPKSHYKELDRGWLLPVSGQVDPTGRAVLCENGRVLTAYGLLEQAGADNELSMNLLDVEPNRPRNEAKGIAGHTYNSYLDESIESDLGLANTPINEPLTKAYLFFDREQSLQEAIVGLLEQHKIELPASEAPTAKLSPPSGE